MQTIIYKVTGLTCDGCVARVKKTLLEYAEHVEVTLDPPMTQVTDPAVDFTQLNKVLAEIGNYALLPNTTPIEIQKDEKKTTQIDKSWLATYKPLLIVFVYILIVTLTVELVSGSFEIRRWMPNFMAGFFIVFSFFKLLDIKGFANSYTMYDLVAKQINVYGCIYPFIELGLGLAYLLRWQPMLINWITLIVMGISTVGVVLAVMKKQTIQCACLGTGFNLPMSTVTIIEDLLMVGMAVFMLAT